MVLRRILFLVMLGLGVKLTPAAAVERTFKQNFELPPGGTVTVDTYRGGILIEEAEGRQVRTEVRVELATEDEDEAAKAIEALKLDVSATGNEVRLRARNPRESRALFAWEEKKRIELTFRIAVPKGATVVLATLDGSVTVGNLTGNVDARTRAGRIFCRKIDGSIKATVDTGEIVISRCTGTTEATVQTGTIRAGTLFGATKLRIDSGDIEVLSALGGIEAKAAAGDVSVGLQKGFLGETKIEADGGNVVLQIEPTVPMNLQASATWGRVATTMPFAVSAGGPGKRSLSGTLNGGGPRVRVHASGGHVSLVSHQLFFDLAEGS
jgi:hypothetical protein